MVDKFATFVFTFVHIQCHLPWMHFPGMVQSLVFRAKHLITIVTFEILDFFMYQFNVVRKCPLGLQMNSTVMTYSGKFFVNFSIMFAKSTVRIPGSITIFAVPSSQWFFFDTFEQMTVERKAIELFGVIFDPLLLNTFDFTKF